MLYELSDVLLEKGEWRVGGHDVRLFKERDALRAAEVAAFREGRAIVGVALILGKEVKTWVANFPPILFAKPGWISDSCK